jgi:hypothetical protein
MSTTSSKIEIGFECTAIVSLVGRCKCRAGRNQGDDLSALMTAAMHRSSEVELEDDKKVEEKVEDAE